MPAHRQFCQYPRRPPTHICKDPPGSSEAPESAQCDAAHHFAVLASVLIACGDSAGPDDSFPQIGGVYDYSATIGGIPSASLTGTMTVVDDSRETTEFSGTFVITLAGGGIAPQSFTGQLTSARVTREGSVQFNFGDPAYPHSGTLTGSTLSGTWTLSGDGSSFSGSFTAIRR